MRVFINEEWGYRYWVWETDLSEEEVIAFFHAWEIQYPTDISLFPGRVWEVEHFSERKSCALLMHIHEEFDSFIQAVH